MDSKNISRLLREIAKLLDNDHDMDINDIVSAIKNAIVEQKNKKKTKAKIEYSINHNKPMPGQFTSMPDKEITSYLSDDKLFPTTRSLIKYAESIGITINSKLNRESTIRAIIKKIEFSKIDQSIRSRSTKS